MSTCNQTRELPQECLVAWRIDRLRDAGFPAGLAATVAHDTRYDVHALLELTDRGCPGVLAARILCPLESECEPDR